MAKRPALSENSFLGFLFKPSKNQQPSGLRHNTLTGRTGRNPRRLRAYNKLSAVQQETLKRSGQREAYLKGETTLAKAKAALRPTAIQLGITKPVRSRTKPAPARDSTPEGRRVRLEAMIQKHLRTVIVDAGRPWNQQTSDAEIVYIEPENEMMDWTYGQVSYAGRRGSEYETFVDGKLHNPFWYH